LEHVRAFGGVGEVARRNANIVQREFFVSRADGYDSGRLGNARRVQQNFIDDAKDRGVCANPQRQSGHCGGCKARTLRQPPETLEHILPNVGHL